MTEQRELARKAAEALRRIVNPRTGKDVVVGGQVKGLSAEADGRVTFSFLLGPGDGPDLVDQARRAVLALPDVSAVDHTVQSAQGPGRGQPKPREDAPHRRKLPIMGQEGTGGGGPGPGGGGPDPGGRRPDGPPGGAGGRRKLPVMGQGAGPSGPSGASNARPGAAPGPGPQPAASPPEPEPLPGVDRVLAISSGKGGVGKSTVATNLAAALAGMGYRVGLMDADVYGPNIPIMFGVYGKPRVTRDQRVIPMEAHGVKLMSIGFLIEGDTPAIWRGPIVMGIIRQFLQQVDWGELDILVVDLPPGTGDAQLSLVQLAQVDGAVMVTTPQGVATADVLKGIKMFERVDVPVLGLIENMSGFECPHCGERTDVFGREGGQKLAATANVPFLGAIPLGATVVQAGDTGRPTVVGAPDSPEGQAFRQVAEQVASALKVEKAEPSRS